MKRLATLTALLCACSQPATELPDAGNGEDILVVSTDGGQDVAAAPTGAVHVHELSAPGDPDFYRTGATAYRFSQWERLDEARREYLTQTNPGLLLVEVEWPQQDLLAAPPDSAWGPHFDGLYGEAFDAVLAAGGSVMLHVAGPPKWASSDPMNTTVAVAAQVWARSPPKPGPNGDYPEWSMAFCKLAGWARARHPTAVEEGKFVIGYGVELDNHEYQGDLATYAPAYDAAAVAVKAVDSSFVVGGGGRLNAFSVKTSPPEHQTTRPVLEVWFEGCESLGCPIDLVFGHNFSLLPTRWSAGEGSEPRSTYGDVLVSVRRLAARYGYTDVGYALTDHTTWEFHDLADVQSWLSSEHDTEYRAAHLAASLVSMKADGYATHTIGTLFEQSGQGGDFVGDWGLFTTSGIAKPSFRAAAVASRLASGELVEIELASDAPPFVSADASRSDEQLHILVTRFVPDTERGRRLLVSAFGHKYLAEGHDPQELARLLGGGDQETVTAKLIDVLTTHDRSALDGVSDEVGALFDSYFDLDQAAVDAGMATVEVTIGFPGLERPHVYRVSSTTSNSYDHCVRQQNACSDPAAVNDGAGSLQAVETADWDPATQTIRLLMEKRQVDLLVFDL